MGGKPIRNYMRNRLLGKTEREIFLSSGLSENRFNEYDNARERMLEESYYLSFDSVFEEVSLLLQYLRSKGCTIWIVTHRSDHKAVEQEIDSFGLVRLIDGWTCTREIFNNDFRALSVNWPKSAARLKAKELSVMQQKHSSVIMVGDSPSDIEAARLAGVNSIALPTGLFNAKQLCEAKPDFIFSNIAILLEELFKG